MTKHGLKYGLLFPGQGTAQVSMGQNLYQDRPEVRKIFEEADEILGWELSKLCFEGPQEVLERTENTHLAVFVTSAAYAKVFKLDHKEEPLFLAGQSLGYLSALLHAGVFRWEDGLKIVRKRGHLLKEQCLKSPGKMAALLGPKNIPRIKYICHETGTVVSNENLNEIVIAGVPFLADKTVEWVRKEKLAKQVIVLATGGAFHSPLVSPVKAPFAAFLSGYKFSDPSIPIIGNSGAQIIKTGEEAGREAIAHIDKTVLWRQSIEVMLEMGVENFEDIGHSVSLGKSLKKWLALAGFVGAAGATVGSIIWYKTREKEGPQS